MKKIICATLIISLIFCSCAKRRETVQGFAMDTVINITVNSKDKPFAEKALSICREQEKIFSRTNDESELSKVNNGEMPRGELKKVIDFAFSVSEKSGGAFDATVKPLSDLWNFKERTVPPTEDEISDALKNVGYKKVNIENFDLGGTSLDLGAIAKGYTADKICEYFKEQGVNNAIIDLGGNVYVLGEFTVGIRNPFEPEKAFAKINLKDKSAVTSGTYQRYFEYDGKKYHHIMDAKTGYPARSGIASVTVISPSSMVADALSTAIFVMGEKGISLCGSFADTDCFIIMEDGSTKATVGFENKYNLKLIK